MDARPVLIHDPSRMMLCEYGWKIWRDSELGIVFIRINDNPCGDPLEILLL